MQGNGNSWNRVDGPCWEPDVRSKNSHRKISPKMIRELAKKSVDGGRARCAICGETFSANYVKMVTISFLHEDHVCADCRREHHLQ